ncbi:hypothetical protein [Pseudomonas vancouverensis]|uniref:Uncharacterized protein n=1 Tax=Pseudomonas vancouverensis TaxID=95300 RepID=A0A1H2NJ76_PSEVA|nr:hypothetical protein [Pseudomonas vancouverensis]KAB0495104.1 hypothetical protein F7R09_16105 [Pseudomonas vancouverensis]TDB63856.1 hypothetical protein EIY72_12140 [Pseudomonas vancouverensis]SDV05493.1 hypothetical protein SAMN05216558_2381 [Pseudomonas vancouverensis]
MSINSGHCAEIRVTSPAPAFCVGADKTQAASKSDAPCFLASVLNPEDDEARLFDCNSHSLDKRLLEAAHDFPLGLGGGSTCKSVSNTFNILAEWPFTRRDGINMTFGK